MRLRKSRGGKRAVKKTSSLWFPCRPPRLSAAPGRPRDGVAKCLRWLPDGPTTLQAGRNALRTSPGLRKTTGSHRWALLGGGRRPVPWLGNNGRASMARVMRKRAAPGKSTRKVLATFQVFFRHIRWGSSRIAWHWHSRGLRRSGTTPRVPLSVPQPASAAPEAAPSSLTLICTHEFQLTLFRLAEQIVHRRSTRKERPAPQVVSSRILEMIRRHPWGGIGQEGQSNAPWCSPRCSRRFRGLWRPSELEPEKGPKRSTYGVSALRAGDRIRTGDVQLGKRAFRLAEKPRKSFSTKDFRAYSVSLQAQAEMCENKPESTVVASVFP